MEQAKLQTDITQLEARIAILEENRIRIRAEVEELKTQIHVTMQEVLDTFKNSLQEAEELSTISYETGKEALVRINLRAIMTMLRGERIETLEALYAMYQIVSAFEQWAELNRERAQTEFDILPTIRGLKNLLFRRLPS